MKDYQKAMLYVYPRIGKIIRDIDGKLRKNRRTYRGIYLREEQFRYFKGRAGKYFVAADERRAVYARI